MRTTIIICVFWALAGLLKPASALTFDEIQEKGEIIVAVYKDFFPYSYRKDGKAVGIDVDIAKHIADRLGVKLDLFELTADETVDDDLRNAVWKGHYLGGPIADVMLHVPYDKAFSLRNNLVFFFGAYLNERIGLVWNPLQIGNLPALDVFRDKRVGVELDTLADFFLTSTMGGALRENVVHFPDLRAAAKAMAEGEVAAISGPMGQLEAAVGDRSNRYKMTELRTPQLTRGQWLIGAAVKHTYRQLGYAVGDILAELVNDGTLKEICERHGVTYMPPPKELLGATAQ